jgi:hypothetical protein
VSHHQNAPGRRGRHPGVIVASLLRQAGLGTRAGASARPRSRPAFRAGNPSRQGRGSSAKRQSRGSGIRSQMSATWGSAIGSSPRGRPKPPPLVPRPPR